MQQYEKRKNLKVKIIERNYKDVRENITSALELRYIVFMKKVDVPVLKLEGKHGHFASESKAVLKNLTKCSTLWTEPVPVSRSIPGDMLRYLNE